MYIVIGIFNFPIENIEHIVPINKYNEFLYIKKKDNILLYLFIYKLLKNKRLVHLPLDII